MSLCVHVSCTVSDLISDREAKPINQVNHFWWTFNSTSSVLLVSRKGEHCLPLNLYAMWRTLNTSMFGAASWAEASAPSTQSPGPWCGHRQAAMTLVAELQIWALAIALPQCDGQSVIGGKWQVPHVSQSTSSWSNYRGCGNFSVDRSTAIEILFF